MAHRLHVRGERVVEARPGHLPRRPGGARRRSRAGASRRRHRGDRRRRRAGGGHRRAHRPSWRGRARGGYHQRADRRARSAVTDSPRRAAATAAIHAGRLPALAGVPVIPPVHRSVIYEFVDADEFADVMGDASRGYLYTRIRNPSTDELGAVVAELEGAEAGLCFASGMGALSAAVTELAPPGAGMVAATQIYGQTHHMATTRPDGRLVDIGDMDALRRAAVGAALVVCETVSNPSLAVADIPAVAEVVHARGRPARRRQHDRDADRLPAARARRRPRLPLGHQVPERPLRRPRRRGRGPGRADRPTRGALARPGRDPRPRLGLARAPRDPHAAPARRAGVRERDGDRHLPRGHPRVRRVLYPACPRTRPTTSPAASWTASAAS